MMIVARMVIFLTVFTVAKFVFADSLTSRPRFDSTPPDPVLIAAGSIDATGKADIVGAAGAAFANARIVILNLNTGEYITSTAGADGSFKGRLFAPPGTSIAIQQQATSLNEPPLHSSLSGLFPGTIIHVPVPGEAQGAFATATLVGNQWPMPKNFLDIATEGHNEGNRLWISGSLTKKEWTAGTSGRLEGRAALFSKGLQTFDLSIYRFGGTVTLERIFDAEGNQEHAHPEAMSHVLTPSGLPIERRRGIDAIRIGTINFSGFTKTNPEQAEATWSTDYQIPSDLPAGIYQLVISPTSDLPLNPTLYYADVAGTNFLGDRPYSSTGVAHITVGAVERRKLTWVLGMNDFSQGSRGVVSVQDAGRFQIAPHVITAAKHFILPLRDTYTREPFVYRLEPFVPMISAANKGTPNPPTVNFAFPSGNLAVKVTRPDGSIVDLGGAPFASNYFQEAAGPTGNKINPNSNSPTHFYGLTTRTDKYDISFDQYGLHIIEVSGHILDTDGNRYDGGGTYEIWVAKPLDFEEGVFPGTPFEVGDTFAPTLTVQPGVPADVEIVVSHYPQSDKSKLVRSVISGRANSFGYFYPVTKTPVSFSEAGEYRVDYTVRFIDEQGALWMGSSTWGSIVETPASRIVTNGRRGFDGGFRDQSQWPTLFDEDEVSVHLQFPFQRGDVMWMEEAQFEPRNIANVPAVTLQDPVGRLTSIMRPRAQRHASQFNNSIANLFDYRVGIGEIPLFSSTSSDISPALRPTADDTHWGYAYVGAARPGVRVREMVSEDAFENAYWRFNDAYNYQAGVGENGDLTNDFKFQFGGAVYRAPNEDFYFYGAYGSLWVLLPETEPRGGRITPPFQGASGGPNGGPLMTLKGKPIDMFFHPTGLRPGSILRLGDTASFSGQLAPTLPSKATITITSPGGVISSITGYANKVGYFYKPGSDFVVQEPGVWKVNIQVVHEGMTSSGPVEAPFPTGNVLGSDNGEFTFYVVDSAASLAQTSTPTDSLVRPGNAIVSVPLSTETGLQNIKLHYTTVMPGFILQQGVSNDLTYRYDARTLAQSFPNLDIQDGNGRTGVDTVTMSFMLSGLDNAGQSRFFGRQVLLQGEQLLALNPVSATIAQARLSMANTLLHRGDNLSVQLNVTGYGSVDLYVALMLPDGSFMTLSNPFALSAANQVIPFKLAQDLAIDQQYTVVDLEIPQDVASGDYAFLAVAVPAGSDVTDFSTWISESRLPFMVSNQ